MAIGSFLWVSLRAIQAVESARGNPVFPVLDLIRLKTLKEQENLVTQNCLTFYGAVKPGYRRFLVKLILLAGGAVAQFRYRYGELVGVTTIHFARFFLVDSGRSMIFLSNYDGTWDYYLVDFLTVGKLAVIPIWSNMVGCPITVGFFEPGENFGYLFRPHIRKYQLPFQVYYSAYKDLSLRNVLNNHAICEGLRNPPKEVESWLRRI